MTPGELRQCPLGPHSWHGLPKTTVPLCPGVWPQVPRVVVDPHPCARCSTGFPVEHTCNSRRISRRVVQLKGNTP